VLYSDIYKYAQLPIENRNKHSETLQHLVYRYQEFMNKSYALKNKAVEEYIIHYIALYIHSVNIVKEVSGRNKKAEAVAKEWRKELDSKHQKDVDIREAYELAYHYVLSSSFPSNKTAKSSITGVDDTGVVRMRKHLDIAKSNNGGWLKEFHKRTKGVVIHCKDFNQILTDYNVAKDAVFYLDLPYFLTCQYDNDFPDEFHLKLLEWIRATNHKWILSCKSQLTNEKEQTNWKGRTGKTEHTRIIYNDAYKSVYGKDYPLSDKELEIDDAERRKPLSEYFKLFVYEEKLRQTYDSTSPNCKRCSYKKPQKKSMPCSCYIADTNNPVKERSPLFVYELEDEKHHEIMISNIEIKKANEAVVEDYKIKITPYEEFLKDYD